MQKKLSTLEEENSLLRSELSNLHEQTQQLEQHEKRLTSDCIQQLSQSSSPTHLAGVCHSPASATHPRLPLAGVCRSPASVAGVCRSLVLLSLAIVDCRRCSETSAGVAGRSGRQRRGVDQVPRGVFQRHPAAGQRAAEAQRAHYREPGHERDA